MPTPRGRLLHDELLVLEKRFSAEGKAIFFACDTLAVEVVIEGGG